jgi:hypothetical protein
MSSIMKTIDQTAQPAGGSAAADKARWIAENLKEGELYAGLILGADGEPDHHLILLPGAAEDVTWAAAKEFATSVGGELPTRREQALLYANLKHEFEPHWYWSSEQHAAYDGFAWVQHFYNGCQNLSSKSASLRARAVRRLIIQ